MMNRDLDGTYNITHENLSEAIDVLSEMRDKLKEVKPIENDARQLSKSIALFLDENNSEGTTTLSGLKASVVRTFDWFWTWELDDDSPEGTISLKTLVPKHLWEEVTKRVVDKERLDQLVREGRLDPNVIKSAYGKKLKATFIRLTKPK